MTPSSTVIYLTTRQMTSSPTRTSFVSAFPILLFILARRSSRSLKKLLRRKKVTVLEPSPWSIPSSSNNQSTRDLENTSCSLFPLQTPLSTWNLRIHDRSSTNSSLETAYTSPPPSYTAEPVLHPNYQTRTPGTNLGPSTSPFIGLPSPNLRDRLKFTGVTSRNALASTNPFHPRIYSPEDRVAIELIEYGREGLLQGHPTATDPPPTPSASQLATYSPESTTPAERPLPTSPPYHTPSTTPVEGEPHIVHPTFAIRPPTPAPGQRRAEVDEESEENPSPAERLQTIVPFVEPQSVTPSPRTEGIRIAPDPAFAERFERVRQRDRPVSIQEQFLVGLLPSHYEEQRAIHLGTETIPTGRPHYYTFVLKVVRERRNPQFIPGSPLHFCNHPHHLYYLSIRQDCSCTETVHHREQWTSHCLDTPLISFTDSRLLEQLARVNTNEVDESWTTYELYQEWITRQFGVIIDTHPLCYSSTN
jgi:hypothetical protein